jgi:hypothetical protein
MNQIAGLNLLIEDENNVILVDYAKKIGLVMRDMQVSISGKCNGVIII